MDASSPKQQVVERLKSATNILVTVSRNPSVDQLASLIGFTLMLNKLGKHATAVYSGLTPNTLEFLEPDETIEKTTDSLRDFIISLDKSKADKLRYKVENDVVKIFITPYRTNLTEKDLIFSQGDFNVEAVVALGVDSRDDLDQAITAHGRILHDATVMTINAGLHESDLGAINWQDEQASSLCEMLVSMSESFQSGLLDTQMATAFLTGIVAETERFSNPKTTPKVMTMSAQLMAAGANQQLIASKLSEKANMSTPAVESSRETSPDADKPTDEHRSDTPPVDTLNIQHDTATEQSADDQISIEPAVDEVKPPGDGTIHIDEHGTMNHLEEMENHEDAIPEKRTLDTKMKTIQPLPPSQTGGPSLTFTPPAFDAPINSSVMPEHVEPSTDPLSHNQTNPAALPAEEPFQPLKTDAPMPAPQPAKTPDAITQALNSLPQISTPSQPPTYDISPQPPAPANPLMQAADETLSEIEKDVHAHQDAPAEAVTLDSARSAVEQAIQGQPFDENRPDPIQALNAQPMDIGPPPVPMPPAPVQPAAPEPVDAIAPPPVPPPLMP